MAFKLNKPTTQGGNVSGALAKPLPMIGHLPFARQVRVLTISLAVTFVVGALSVVLDERSSSHSEHYVELASDLDMLSQRLAKDAGSAVQGKQTAIDGLPRAREDFEKILTALEKGDDEAPAAFGPARVKLDALLPQHEIAMQYIKNIEAGRPAILALVAAMQVEFEATPALRSAIARMPSSGSVDKFAILIERINYETSQLLSYVVTEEMTNALSADIAQADTLLNGFDKGSTGVAETAELFAGYKKAVLALTSQSKGLIFAKQGVSKYFDMVSVTKKGPLITGVVDLQQTFVKASKGRWTTYLMGLSGTLLLLLAAALSKVQLAEARRSSAAAEATNKQTQGAILRLMNELSDLGDGDLTVRATVTEDITGAIADSVNYTAEELHKLVSNVSRAAGQMGEATQESEELSQRLLVASDKQAREIKDAEESVQLIVRSIGEVDAAAIKATAVGKQTLEVTTQGAQAVRNTIAGMDGIREHIQETSKRIKRLGESSQEIGEIVDLISDITEQTNVLALNAAIQAASAGEAGRGFSVVAEEVQRLAERSADATKQIGALVKMIQSDTHDAVAAMEKSTLGVVEGAKLSEMSGQSLKEIEVVSEELAMLINSISVSTQVQTDMAGEVASVMHEIMKLTRQTAEGSRLTSDSAIKLTGLASGLRGSVAGFKL
jgi:twitching motility protein PilJ